MKSNVIPDQLLKAEPGSRLYPSLVKKVESICSRDLAELEKHETERFRVHVLKGNADKALDTQRSALATTLSNRKQQLFTKYAKEFSHSDHLQVQECMQIGEEVSTVTCSWNVLEFPALGAKKPVVDGVRPVCDAILNALARKSSECMQLLLEAMCSEVVIHNHTERVLSFIEDSLKNRSADVVLLQEVGEQVQDHILDMCMRFGWAAHFSTKNDDAAKCDAITAIVAKNAFDEVTEIEVQRQKKVRRFAAARHGTTWVVSCHLPLVNDPKGKQDQSDANGNFENLFLQQLWSRFGHTHDAGAKTVVIVGGDWNHPVRDIIDLASASPPEGCASVCLRAPQCATTLCDFCSDSTKCAIDGFFCLQ